MSTALYFIIWRMIFSIGIQNSWRSWNNAGRNEDEGSPDKPGGLSIQLCKSEKKEFYIRYSS